MGLHIVSLNVDSLVHFGRRNLFKQFLFDYKIDVCLAQETKLDHLINFKFAGYNIIRQDDIRGRCGTAIFVRSSIPIRKPTFYNDLFQSTSIEIGINNTWYGISSCYFPPGRTVNISHFKKFFSKHNGSLLGGDFNGHNVSFGDLSNNLYGNYLLDSVNNIGGIILNPPSPSCFRSVHGSFIDKFININSGMQTSNISLLPSFSDHSGISIKLLLASNQRVVTNPSFDFNKIEIEKFNSFLELNIQRMVVPTTSNITHEQIEILMDEFNSMIATGIKRYVPTLPSDGINRIILSKTTRILQANCKGLQRKLFRNNPGMQLHTKKQILNRIGLLKNMIRNACSHDAALYYTNLYNNIKSSRDAFKIIKNFSGHKRNGGLSGSIFIDESKTEAISGHTNIAGALGTHFAKNHLLTSNFPSKFTNDVVESNTRLDNTNLTIPFDDNISPIIRNADQLAHINSLLPIQQPNLLTSAEEIQNIIDNRPNKKSSGSDNLPYTVIKNLSPLIILFLTTLLNHMVGVAYFPECWKNALVSSIPKPGKDSSILSNWRPISQLCCLSKIFEKLITNRINNSLRGLPIFQNQFGFLAGHSTEHALARIQNEINNGLNQGKVTSMVAIDLKAAFDVIWHEGLIFKMIKLGINPFLCRIIKHFLRNRSFAIRLDGHITEKFNMEYGAPQGSVLSPTLFNIYLNDIPTHPHIKITQFADDTTLHYTHDKPVIAQKYFNWYLTEMCEYFRNWKLMLSENKTEFLNVMGLAKDTNPKLRQLCRNMKIKINGTIIKQSSNIRLLGVQFQSNNRFTENVKLRLQKAGRAKFCLKRLLKKPLHKY